MKAEEKEIEHPAVRREQTLRITMMSKGLREIEKLAADVHRLAVSKDAKCKNGPASLPKKTLTVTTRRSPCGEGSKTYDRFSMTIHKRILDITTTVENFRAITSAASSPNVFVQVMIVKG